MNCPFQTVSKFNENKDMGSNVVFQTATNMTFPNLTVCHTRYFDKARMAGMLCQECVMNNAMLMLYRVVQKNSCMFEFSLPSSAHCLRQPMHSPSALTELSSPNLAGTFSHNPVEGKTRLNPRNPG